MKLLEEILLFVVVRVIWFVGSLFWISAGAAILLGGGSRRISRYATEGHAVPPSTLLLYPEFWHAIFAVCAVIALCGPAIRTYHRNRGRGKLKEIREMSIVRPWRNVRSRVENRKRGNEKAARPEDRTAED